MDQSSQTLLIRSELFKLGGEQLLFRVWLILVEHERMRDIIFVGFIFEVVQSLLAFSFDLVKLA